MCSFVRKSLLFIFLLISPTCGHLDDAAKANIDTIANKIIGCRDMVGMNLAIVQDGITLYTKGYGVIDRDNQIPVTDTSLFGLASVSKAFAATLLGHVLSKYSNYTWDTPVRDILGEDMVFPMAEMTVWTSVRDMLSHRTGLSKDNRIRMDPTLNREELVRRIRFLTPVKPYKTSYYYNNLMYGLATRVTEVVGGKSWEQLMMQEIFEPLGMAATSFTHVRNLNRTDVAKPYSRTNEGDWRKESLFLHSEWGKLGGSGSIVSNARDMTRWLNFQLTYGLSSDRQQVVDSDVIEDTHTPCNVIPQTDRDREYVRPQAPASYVINGYGLGWKTGFYRGYPLVSHTGTSWGYATLVTLVPSLNIGIHTSVTGTDPGYRGRRALHIYIMDLLMNQNPWLNSSNVCQFPQPNSRSETPAPEPQTPAQPLNHYTGTYGNFGYGNISIDFDQPSQSLFIIYGKLGKFKLVGQGGDTFTGVGQDFMWSSTIYDVIFSEHVDGKFQSVTLTSFDRRAPPTFRRGLRSDEAPPPPALECDTNSSPILSTPSLLVIVALATVSQLADL